MIFQSGRWNIIEWSGGCQRRRVRQNSDDSELITIHTHEDGDGFSEIDCKTAGHTLAHVEGLRLFTEINGINEWELLNKIEDIVTQNAVKAA